MKLVTVIAILLLTGCTSFGQTLRDAQGQIIEAKTETYNLSLDYVCNGGSIRDMRKLLAVSGMSIEEFNDICSFGRIK